MLCFCQSYHQKQTLVPVESKYNSFHSLKFITKCCMQYGGHLVRRRVGAKLGIVAQFPFMFLSGDMHSSGIHWIQALTCWSIRQISALPIDACYPYRGLLPQHNTRISIYSTCEMIQVPLPILAHVVTCKRAFDKRRPFSILTAPSQYTKLGIFNT